MHSLPTFELGKSTPGWYRSVKPKTSKLIKKVSALTEHLAGFLAGTQHDLLTSGVLGDVKSHVVHKAINDGPTVVLSFVLGDLVEGDRRQAFDVDMRLPLFPQGLFLLFIFRTKSPNHDAWNTFRPAIAPVIAQGGRGADS